MAWATQTLVGSPPFAIRERPWEFTGKNLPEVKTQNRSRIDQGEREEDKPLLNQSAPSTISSRACLRQLTPSSPPNQPSYPSGVGGTPRHYPPLSELGTASTPVEASSCSPLTVFVLGHLHLAAYPQDHLFFRGTIANLSFHLSPSVSSTLADSVAPFGTPH